MKKENYVCNSKMIFFYGTQKMIFRKTLRVFFIFSFHQRGAERVKVLEINGVQCFFKPKHSSKHFILCYFGEHCLCGRCSIIAQSIVRSHWSRSIIVCVVNMKYGILQWCSLRDTQVYAVYPLGKSKDFRIPT